MKKLFKTLILAIIIGSGGTGHAAPMDFAEANTLSEQELGELFCKSDAVMMKNALSGSKSAYNDATDEMVLAARLLIRKFNHKPNPTPGASNDIVKCDAGKFVEFKS